MGFTVGTNMFFFFLSCYFNAGFSLINIQFIKVTKLKYSFLMLFISIYKFYSSYKCLFMDLKSIMLTEKKVRGKKKTTHGTEIRLVVARDRSGRWEK